MKHIVAMICLVGCYEPESGLDLNIDVIPQNQEVIDGNTVFPYRAGGTFVVKVIVSGKHFETSTRATLAVESTDLVMGATATASITLGKKNETDEFLVGTGSLAWPPGGKISMSAEALGVRDVVDVEIEKPVLKLASAEATNNGTQTTMDLCFDSTTADGIAVVHVEGATIKDSNEAMVPLTMGTCNAMPTIIGASSHGRVKVTPTAPSLMLLATLPNTGFSLPDTITVPTFGEITLQQTHTPASPTAGEIVTLIISATRPTGGNAGIVVSLQSSPATLPFLPATATTDSNGEARVKFQMPSSGGVVIQARVGNVTDEENVP